MSTIHCSRLLASAEAPTTLLPLVAVAPATRHADRRRPVAATTPAWGLAAAGRRFAAAGRRFTAAGSRRLSGQHGGPRWVRPVIRQPTRLTSRRPVPSTRYSPSRRRPRSPPRRAHSCRQRRVRLGTAKATAGPGRRAVVALLARRRARPLPRRCRRTTAGRGRQSGQQFIHNIGVRSDCRVRRSDRRQRRDHQDGNAPISCAALLAHAKSLLGSGTLDAMTNATITSASATSVNWSPTRAPAHIRSLSFPCHTFRRCVRC